jgi:2-polyprenyl-6-methoxyphenol hydroxylase-like FAD-dependent oxidoreductase
MSAVETVLIVGGGLAGLTLARALNHQGLTVELIERGTEWRAEDCGIAVQPNGMRILRTLGLPVFLLDYRGVVLHSAPDTYVAHPEPHEVTALQLAVDGEIEQSEVSSALFKLEPDADCPDLLRSQRTFLTNEATLVPGSFGKADK